jgi:hypothetical protein
VLPGRQAEGARTRTAIIDWLANQLTDPSCPLTTEQMNHFRMVSAYFPEGREIAEKIDRSFADTPELRTAILLSTIVTCLDTAARLTVRTDPCSSKNWLLTGWSRWSSRPVLGLGYRSASDPSKHRPHEQKSMTISP